MACGGWGRRGFSCWESRGRAETSVFPQAGTCCLIPSGRLVALLGVVQGRPPWDGVVGAVAQALHRFFKERREVLGQICRERLSGSEPRGGFCLPGIYAVEKESSVFLEGNAPLAETLSYGMHSSALSKLLSKCLATCYLLGRT